MTVRRLLRFLVAILAVVVWGDAAQAICPPTCPVSDVFQIVDKTTGNPLTDLVTGQPTVATLHDSITPEQSVTFTVPFNTPGAFVEDIALTEEPVISGLPEHASDTLISSFTTVGSTQAIQITFTSNVHPPSISCSFYECIQETGQLQDLTSILLQGGTEQTWLVQVESDVDPDTDGDGVPDSVDNCPFMPNGPNLGTCLGASPQGQATCHANSDCTSGHCSLNQEDSGGFNTTVADGIGDACQCGDVNNDGIVNGPDATAIVRALSNLTPYGAAGVTALPGYQKCDVNGDGSCSGPDGTAITRKLGGLSNGYKVGLCPAAVCHSPEVMNGVTCPVLP